MAMLEHILIDGAIPAKYKLLMGMVTDTIVVHPDGVAKLANDARAAGATENEITEAVEVRYLYGSSTQSRTSSDSRATSRAMARSSSPLSSKFKDLAPNLACGGGDDDHVSSSVRSIALLYEYLKVALL
jgi:hypothetical protein